MLGIINIINNNILILIFQLQYNFRNQQNNNYII